MAYKSKYTGQQVDEGLDLAYEAEKKIQDAVRPIEWSLNQEAQSRQSEDKNIRDSIETVSNRVTTAEGQITGLQGNITTLQTEVVNIKNNEIPQAVAEGIAEVVANSPEDLDTLKEVADYIASDKTKAAQIETSISNLNKSNTQNAANISKNASDITANTEALAKQAKELNTKAPKNGYAPDLKVDFAKELVGRGVAEPQEIGAIRPTGLISIGDGNATIEKVKGKSVVWNQQQSGEINFTHMTSNDGINFTLNSVVNVGNVYYRVTDKAIVGNKYVCIGEISNSIGRKAECETLPLNTIFISSKQTVSITPLGRGINGSIGDTVTIVKKPRLYDLTQMFGAGNEPTTVEEFEARKPLGVTDDYNEGEIISYDAQVLKSVGFNAFNGTYAKVIGGQQYHALGTITSIGFTTDLGGETTAITLDSEGMFTPTENGYVYAEGTDICIHLTHTYTPDHTTEYEEDVLTLPNIKAIKDNDGNQLFPYGLLSAGSVHDEITATKAVKKVNSVVLDNFEWKYSNNIFYTLNPFADAPSRSEGVTLSVFVNIKLITDNGRLYIMDSRFTNLEDFVAYIQGATLNYELATPIEIDLPEPLNLTYDAWDFGTEELIAEGKTTPLNADIVYKFNAVDLIRENTAKNQALDAELAEIKAQLTQLTQVTNGEDSNA